MDRDRVCYILMEFVSNSVGRKMKRFIVNFVNGLKERILVILSQMLVSLFMIYWFY